MHSREVLRIVIMAFILCVVLAGFVATAGAADGTLMKNQPGALPAFNPLNQPATVNTGTGTGTGAVPAFNPLNQPATVNTGTGTGTTQYGCKNGVCGVKLADGTIVTQNKKDNTYAMVKPDGSIATGPVPQGLAIPPATQPAQNPPALPGTGAIPPASQPAQNPPVRPGTADTRSQYDKDNNICGWSIAGKPMYCPPGGPPAGWTPYQS